MVSKATKLRLRRHLRRGRRQVGDIGIQAEEQLDQHLFRRMGNLSSVRRFVATWMLLMAMLIGSVVYQISALADKHEGVRPVAGGIYTEGIVGPFTNANPLYAASSVDSAVSKLLFGGLLKYDSAGKLVGDLAVRWSADDSGKTYKVVLRSGLQWHDGQPLTAEDVAFTYRTIQNADAKSPLFYAWQGVKVEVRDDRTILFTLPNVLSSFPYALTNGIVPKHLLETIPPGQLRSIQFDTVNPVGSGPFKWSAIEVTGDTPETRQTQIALSPFAQYYGGMPKLDQLRIHTFTDKPAMIASFERQELTAMSGLDVMPATVEKMDKVHDMSVPYMGEVGVFFRTSSEKLADVKVRQALVESINHQTTLAGLPYPVSAARGPLLGFHLGYNKDIVQLPFDIQKAAQQLDEAEWKLGADGMRVNKDGKPLELQLYAQDTDEFNLVVARLTEQWRAVGVKINVTLQPEDDLRRSVNDREYDLLLYGIAVGADPDVFAYWHSSQADAVSTNHLNLSDYKSAVVDRSLEDGRTRTDPDLRAIKYKPFLEAWRQDAPAVMLYQPRYVYITHGLVRGLDLTLLNSSTDRYTSVEQWTIRELRAPQ